MCTVTSLIITSLQHFRVMCICVCVGEAAESKILQWKVRVQQKRMKAEQERGTQEPTETREKRERLIETV